MKIVSHGNLVNLIGIVIDSTNLQFVYQYCSKGSLNHLLEKMNIDWEFRAALLNDLFEVLFEQGSTGDTDLTELRSKSLKAYHKGHHGLMAITSSVNIDCQYVQSLKYHKYET
jgi:Protein tyrosine and serine/threonine kinase